MRMHRRLPSIGSSVSRTSRCSSLSLSSSLILVLSCWIVCLKSLYSAWSWDMSASGRRHFAKRDAPRPDSDEEENSGSEEKRVEVTKGVGEAVEGSEPAGLGHAEPPADVPSAAEPSAAEPAADETSESDDSTGSDESESEPEQISRPRFVRRAKPAAAAPVDTKQSTLELIERTVRAETQLDHSVDDTDGLDPDAEYRAWKERARARAQREHDRLAAAEQEYEERELARELDAKRRKLA